MKYEDWKKNPIRFRAMTGYDVAEFNDLLIYFSECHDNYMNKYHLNGKIRTGRRSYSIYQNSPLGTVEERLVFILSYWKLNPIQEQHADMFGMTQKQCNDFLHALGEILKKALTMANVVPAQTNEDFQELATKECSDNKVLLHDGTEREVPRPVDDDEQKDHYSGKKKKHTLKNAVIATTNCLILLVSASFPGRVHDKKIADIVYSIPKNFVIVQDTGYQGHNPEGVRVVQPLKKPRGKELTEEQKASNQKISSFRVRIEHAIGGVKRYRIVKDECRLRKNNFVGEVFLWCAALHNFRLKTRPFTYENNSI